MFFPPTFAATGRGKSDYQIDWFGPRDQDRKDPEAAAKDGVIANRCTVDSVPSQANRLEARLLKYSGTSIPKVTITGSRVGQDARIVSIEFASGGPIAGVHVATQYRTNGYLGETPKLHIGVTFDRPVAGPLAVGRGRHVGFGLLWPT